MLGAQTLLSHTTNTKAELIVFTFAFQLAQGQSLSIYANSK